ncbi:MAG TPA: LysM domain-containing protein [Chthoniobacteraceae bacterium]|nr:LysM domain-containing protein [Chthoniobacteraceae bacterium]
MKLISGIAAALALGACMVSAQAADPKSKAPTSKDFDALRQTIEEQSKQIEALTQQVAHLTEVMEAHGISTGTTGAASPAPAVATTPAPAASPEPASASSATGDKEGTHTVTKGETLTSIAKHYKISVTELEKVNKIENDRTLQIGQVLVIPAPGTSPSPTPEEKKENQ